METNTNQKTINLLLTQKFNSNFYLNDSNLLNSFDPNRNLVNFHDNSQRLSIYLFFYFLGSKRELRGQEIISLDRQINNLVRSMDSKKRTHQADLKQKTKDLAAKSELGRYAREMVALCEEIDRNVHLFKTKPIGPLGRHIKLTQDANKNEGLNTLLEIQLGMKNLRSFLVACNEDRLVLEKMMQKQWTSRTRQPMITVRKR